MDNYRSVETRICVVCQEEYEVNTVVVADHVHKAMGLEGKPTKAGWCYEHDAMKKAGYIAIFEARPVADSTPARTGNFMHLHGSIFKEVFNLDPPEAGFCFTGPSMFKQLQSVADTLPAAAND